MKNKRQEIVLGDLAEETMHSFGHRANASFTFALTVLALLCALASFSDNFNSQSPEAQVQVRFIQYIRVFFCISMCVRVYI